MDQKDCKNCNRPLMDDGEFCSEQCGDVYNAMVKLHGSEKAYEQAKKEIALMRRADRQIGLSVYYR